MSCSASWFRTAKVGKESAAKTVSRMAFASSEGVQQGLRCFATPPSSSLLCAPTAPLGMRPAARASHWLESLARHFQVPTLRFAARFLAESAYRVSNQRSKRRVCVVEGRPEL